MLAFTYLFQGLDYSNLVGIISPFYKFIFNKTLRLVVNDTACLLLIVAVFNKSGYIRVSTWLFLIELFLLLPLYLALKLFLEGTSEISSPLLSQVHRMIVNPLLMIVLMLGFIYQDYYWKKPNL